MSKEGYYANLGDLERAGSVAEAKDYLRKGWELLRIADETIPQETGKGGIVALQHQVFYMGLRSRVVPPAPTPTQAPKKQSACKYCGAPIVWPTDQEIRQGARKLPRNIDGSDHRCRGT